MQQNHNYSKVKCLFKGYDGKVYLIERISENNPPNVKQPLLVLKRYYRKPQDQTDHTTLTEFRYLTKLSHPNIVNILDGFTEQFEYKKYFCLIMEHMAPIHELLHSIKGIELYIFKQICEAIKYLHEQNIIHRDIKPSNIFATKNGKIKLGDFGITTNLKQQMTPQTCTKNYRAPELFFGYKEYDTSIDIWSLGCTLVELYTAKLLFDGRSEIEIMTQIANLLGSLNEQNWPNVSTFPTYLEFVNEGIPKITQLLSSLPKEIQPIVQGMLQMNPKERPTIQQIIQYIDSLNISDQSTQIAYIAQNQLAAHLGNKQKFQNMN